MADLAHLAVATPWDALTASLEGGMSGWRRRLYDGYVSSEQGGMSSSRGYRPEAPFLNHIIARDIPADRNISILDLGCGAGGMIFWLKKAGYLNISGVNSSPEMVAAAAKAGVIEVDLGDLQVKLKTTADNSVDVVIVMDVLEHMDREVLFEICDDIFRVLRPGGRIVAHVPNAEGIFGSYIRYGDLTHELALHGIFYTTTFSDDRLPRNQML